jgi:hypothetical protein
MTIGAAWVGHWSDGRKHLYMASDSRTRGMHVLDACPKILTLPRSDCALCFAGNTLDTYPLMIQLASAIAAHEPARDRSLDIARVKSHLLRLFTDLVSNRRDAVESLSASDAQFIFAGYSWLKKDFRIWTIYYEEKDKKFAAREAISFATRLRKAAFIGDWATRLRGVLAKQLSVAGPDAYLEPLKAIAHLLDGAKRTDTIGGSPQVIRVTEHMNTRPLCVRWKGKDTLFGRPLFAYENTDYLIVDPSTGEFLPSRNFGRRTETAEATDEEIAND